VLAGLAAFLLTRDDDRGTEPRARAGLELALQDNAVLLERRYFDRERAFERARELGVTWIKVPVIWSRVGDGPDYDWSQVDSLVDAARDAGFEVELQLTGPAPAPATGDGRVGVVRPDAERFGALTRAAVTHFGTRVDRWIVWNEPNLVNWLSPVEDAPALYRRLYEAAYAAIRASDPGAQVLIGETAPYVRPGDGMAPLAFLRELTRGAPLHADGYSHHPYDFRRAPGRPDPDPDNVTIGSLDRLIGALDGLAASGRLATRDGRPLDVYLTEFGYLQRTRRAVPPERRADYLRRAYELASSRYPRVRQLLQYLLVSPPEGYPGGRFDTALLTRAGEPTPAFRALAALSR
jgi:cellulase (glycosyl hydrolase family 5)